MQIPCLLQMHTVGSKASGSLFLNQVSLVGIDRFNLVCQHACAEATTPLTMALLNSKDCRGMIIDYLNYDATQG